MPTKKKKPQVYDAAPTDFTQDAHNFNRGTAEGARLMDKSFQELGAGRSILVDRNGNIIAGNKSQEAAIRAGIKRVKVIETDGTELVAVKRTDIDINSEQGRRLALADNATTQVNLSWDEAQLAEVSDQIEGFDPGEWGVSMPDIANPVEAKEVKEDNFDPDAEKIEPNTRRGDIYRLGTHVLMCGDSTRRADVQTLMQGKLADLWLTDPPYGVDYSAAKDRAARALGQEANRKTIIGDAIEDEAFTNLLYKSFAAAADSIKEGGAFYVWYAGLKSEVSQAAIRDAGLLLKEQIIWRKNAPVIGWYDYNYQHEPCWYGWKPGASHYFTPERNHATVISDEAELDIDHMKLKDARDLLHKIMDNPTPTTVIDCPKPQRSELHPTMKPIRLFAQLIQNSSRPGETVLDTFGGSGTTIIACEQLQRSCRMMELDPQYCDVIIQRWEKFTGKKAQLIGNAKTE